MSLPNQSFSSPSNEQEDEALSPEMARVAQKLRRLGLLSSLMLGLGLIAVLIAIVFKLSQESDPLPLSGERVVSMPDNLLIEGDFIQMSADYPYFYILSMDKGVYRLAVYDQRSGEKINHSFPKKKN
jgi:hypothetical protein